MSGVVEKDAKRALCASWAKRVETACENDSWGQILDAAEEYENVIKSIANSVVSPDSTSGRSNPSSSNSRPASGSPFKSGASGVTATPSDVTSSGDGGACGLRWDSTETEFLKNVALCLKERVDVIQSPISKEHHFARENVSCIIGPLRNMSLQFPETVQDRIKQVAATSGRSLEEDKIAGGRDASCSSFGANNNNILLKMKTGRLIEMDSLFGNSNHNGDVGSPSSDEDELSTNGRGGAHDNQSAASGQGQVIAKQTIVAVALPGNLLPQLPKQPGQTLLEVVIEKVSLKDAPKVNDSFWMVSVKDNIGLDLTAIQSTPSEGVRSGNDIVFNTSVHIQLPLEKLPKGWAVFFELKYPKNEKVIALKCWSLLESDEVKSDSNSPQEVVCELYKKPTDFRRKKISLLTSKQLYLHLRLIKHS